MATEGKYASARSSSSGSKKRKNSKTLVAILCIGIIVTFGFCVYLGMNTISQGATSAAESYKQAYATAEDEAYHWFYDAAYERNKVTNDVSIQIESIRETASLEVLRISDVEYVIYDENDNDDGIVVWLEVPGTGVYTVNLQAAEFIVDDCKRQI